MSELDQLEEKDEFDDDDVMFVLTKYAGAREVGCWKPRDQYQRAFKRSALGLMEMIGPDALVGEVYDAARSLAAQQTRARPNGIRRLLETTAEMRALYVGAVDDVDPPVPVEGVSCHYCGGDTVTLRGRNDRSEQLRCEGCRETWFRLFVERDLGVWSVAPLEHVRCFLEIAQPLIADTGSVGAAAQDVQREWRRRYPGLTMPLVFFSETQ